MATVALPDMPSFRVVPPNGSLKLSDLELPDHTPMVGPDGLLVPPARSFSMIVNSASRVLSSRFDEAMRDNFIAARAMRRDGFLDGLFEERILPTINRTWQLEVDDDTDPAQALVRDGLTKIIQNIPDFDQFKRANLDAVWFGRAGCQWSFKRNDEIDDLWAIPRWDPLHGDSIQYTFDGVPAIMLDSMTTGWYSDHGASWGQNGDGDLRPTDRGGTALVLQRPYWRNRFTIHSHIRRKADYFEGELAGSVQGLGLRGQVYWLYTLRTDALTWMIAYMQAVGAMDLLVFNFPAGNAEAKRQQEANANKVIGKAAIVCPRNPTGNWPAVEQIQMNAAGMKALHELVADYFDRHIERLFVGQSMSSGADKGDGLGGTGRSEFAQSTKDEILVYDTGRLDSTNTYDLVRPLKLYNYPWAKFPVRFKSVMPDLKAKDKVEASKIMVDFGVPIKTAEIRSAADFSKPTVGDEVLAVVMPGTPPVITKIGQDGKPEIPEEMLQQMMAPPPGPGGPGGMDPNAPPGGMPPGMGGPPGMPPGMPGGPGMPPGGPPMLPQGPPTQMAAQGPVGAPNAPYSVPAGYDGGGGGAGGAGGGGMGAPGGGAPPANGPVMGGGGYYPGGGNTYMPKFRDRRHPEDIIGFTRGTGYARKPLRYGDVEDENAFHQLLDENPEDHQTRMIFADWLQDRNDPRAEGYRALGQLGKRPLSVTDNANDEEDRRDYHTWAQDTNRYPVGTIAGSNVTGNYPVGDRHGLPRDWHALVTNQGIDGPVWSWHGENASRRQAEDAAASAWNRLPPERQQEILKSAQPPQEPTQASRYARISIQPGEPLMGGADFMHEIHDEQGNRVGHLWVSPMDNGERLHINHVGAMGHEANSLGPAVMRDAMRQLRTHYPQAKRITGTRVSGAKRANTGEDQPTEVNFNRGNRPANYDFGDTDVTESYAEHRGVRYADELDPQEHAAFQQKIDENPLDPLNHLVLADWLQDRGHDDEAAFRRSLGEWIPNLTAEGSIHSTPDNVGAFWSVDPRDTPKDVDPVQAALHSEHVSQTTGRLLWTQYRGMEEGLRRAFMANLQRQRAQQQQEPTQSARYDRRVDRAPIVDVERSTNGVFRISSEQEAQIRAGTARLMTVPVSSITNLPQDNPIPGAVRTESERMKPWSGQSLVEVVERGSQYEIRSGVEKARAWMRAGNVMLPVLCLYPNPSNYERRHAPKGGITMNGREKPYKPGQFVPGTMMLTHSAQLRAPVSFGGPDSDDAFDPEQLAAGTRYESRTVKDPQQARNRAKDKLTRDPDFYRRLEYEETPSAAHHEPADFTNPQAFGQSLARAVTKHTGNQEHGNAAMQMVSRLTPAVFDRLKENRLTHFVSHATPESLNQHWREDGTDPVEGFHSGKHKQIHFGPEDPIGTIAHELAHAFDWNEPYPGGGGYALSGNPASGWHPAWKQEIADSGTPEPKLTGYAEESPKEGLAELYRLILTHPQGLEMAQKNFPQSFAVLKKWGVV